MPNATQFGLSQIGQISVTVHDLERAATFYRNTLGVKHLFTVPNMAFFECGGIRLMLSIPTRPDLDHPSSILYFKVADIQVAYETLVSRGIHFETKPTLIAPMAAHDLWLAEFRDSERNVLCLMCEIPKKA
jgi:methylmalonyl-CoA/ethylmalonyl-CoA epimerase